MAATLEAESTNLWVLRVSGTLKRDEFAAFQTEAAQKIDAGSKPKLLVILENFDGWERGADWNDLDFLVSHSGEISKISVVADPQWEAKALAFAGAGVRSAPVRFFSLTELTDARAWLAQ